MSYKLRYSPEAQRDMDKVWDDVYHASQNIEIAQKYVEDFIATIEKKKKYPTTGTPLYHGAIFTGYYSISFKEYKAFYRIKDTYVEVVRIIYSRRDYMNILFNK